MPLSTGVSAWGTYPEVPHIFPIHSPFEVSHLQTSKVGNLWGTHGECNLGFPTSESLSTSAFRESCGEWGKKWITRIAKPHSDQGQRTDPPFLKFFIQKHITFKNSSYICSRNAKYWARITKNDIAKLYGMHISRGSHTLLKLFITNLK